MELALWTGAWAGDGDGLREARMLVSKGEAPVRVRRGGMRAVTPWTDEEAGRQTVLVEPDAALIRAGLIGDLALELDLRPVGPDIAYLAGATPPTAAGVRAWRIVDSAPADPRRVREMLAHHDVGAVHVRKRGHPDTGEVLARRFAGRGKKRGHLAVARTAGGHRVFLLEAMTEGNSVVGDEGFEPPTSSV
ncbi:MAG: hypothetical protein K8S98_14930 [Planctomycetes bacterium]|nr:hypothetical protein [Planctomycetota bacterium]